MSKDATTYQLNPDYVEISRRRVGQAMPLFAEVQP